MIEYSLCDLIYNNKIITKKYYEDMLVIVVDCKKHGVPIVLFKAYTGEDPHPAEIRYCQSIAENLFPGKKGRDFNFNCHHLYWHQIHNVKLFGGLITAEVFEKQDTYYKAKIVEDNILDLDANIKKFMSPGKIVKIPLY